jgi:hypothetical protein
LTNAPKLAPEPGETVNIGGVKRNSRDPDRVGRR